MSTRSITIVGSVALDTIETPFNRKENLIGGSATYATIASGRSSPVYPVGIVGSDFPLDGFEIFQKYSADLSDFQMVTGNTFRWGGKYDHTMDNRETLFTELGVFEGFSPILSQTCRKSDYLFLANIHPLLQLSVMDQMEGHPIVIVDTMNLWIDTAKKQLLEVIKNCDIFLINDSEAELLSGQKSLEKAAEKFLELGPNKVIIKRGSKGCVSFSDENTISIGTFPVKNVVDSTGAGDTFGGGYITGIASGLGEMESIIHASALASVCVEDFGIQALLSLKDEELIYRQKIIRESVSP
ncbi:MAG: PfkB family carbohydrate kinase [Candidatus Marinimicrobia bacterium]|jgi:sugar/nucleoside kinase (ribokinase family)|nr:PfkB family carbohydrate kinase [Candidatus Neomarinimicrobiota bacterium]HJM47240.1 PfkB family carbohydrate kinase [Candidatus Neomarinimicrobiota bacterium]|tara:strand:- start:1170 stop:2063 length:894 start_codon:yes stop_codon:yes gene_type:complete